MLTDFSKVSCIKQPMRSYMQPGRELLDRISFIYCLVQKCLKDHTIVDFLRADKFRRLFLQRYPHILGCIH